MSLRSYLTFPTVVFMVGPDLSRIEKMCVWALSGLLGGWLGYAWFADFARATFVLNGNDNVFGVFVAFTGLLILPMVCGAAILPIAGGGVLALSAGLSALFIFPASHFAWHDAATLVVKLFGPAFLVGVGFLWSARNPSAAKVTRRW